jgi:hypothetical protein
MFIPDKKLKTPNTDIKKKPSYELLSLIGKIANSDITPHPFTKLKPPKKEKIEEIFVKSQKDVKKNSNKKLKKKSY